MIFQSIFICESRALWLSIQLILSKSPIAAGSIIKPDEKTNTTTVQPERVSDSSEIPAPDNRGRDSKTDEETFNDKTAVSSESGTRFKRNRSPVGKVGRLDHNNEAKLIVVL